MSKDKFHKFINNSFNCPPEISGRLYDRFRRHRDLNEVPRKDDGMIVDLVGLAFFLILISQMVKDLKIQLAFDLCDDDGDGHLTPNGVLFMMQQLERIFTQE